MNPPNNEVPSIELPSPVTEQPSNAANSPEQASPGTPSTQNTPQTVVLMPPTIPLPMSPGTPVIPIKNDATVATSAPSLQQLSDDGDLIEKEWVNKAKEIVERNRNDPYKQSEELTVFRADYMKKHYNKTIKLNK